jgi:methionyl-tRNA formyltransferase
VLNIIYARAILNSPAQHPAGTVIILDGGQLAVACGTGLLALETVQLDGAKRQNTRDFLNGHPSFIGSMLI